MYIRLVMVQYTGARPSERGGAGRHAAVPLTAAGPGAAAKHSPNQAHIHSHAPHPSAFCVWHLITSQGRACSNRLQPSNQPASIGSCRRRARRKHQPFIHSRALTAAGPPSARLGPAPRPAHPPPPEFVHILSYFGVAAGPACVVRAICTEMTMKCGAAAGTALA